MITRTLDTLPESAHYPTPRTRQDYLTLSEQDEREERRPYRPDRPRRRPGPAARRMMQADRT